MNPQVSKTVLAVGAHPDDVEILCAGTLAHLKARGWTVAIATMTPGDCGSRTLGRPEISAIRKSEAAASAKLLDAAYHCMECDDIFVMYDRPTLVKVVGLIRLLKPDLVFTMSPQDYMVDHETTSAVVQTACFSAGIKNVETPGIDAFFKVPCLYYFDPIDGKDKLGNPVHPTTIVDISDAMPLKERMFFCHESQLDWLKAHHSLDHAIAPTRIQSSMRGKEIGVRFAEGFRQHLGQAFPQDNLLEQELEGLVHLSDRPHETIRS